MDISVVDILHILDGHARALSRAIENPQTLSTEAVKTHVARMYGLAETLHDTIEKQKAAASDKAEEAKAN